MHGEIVCWFILTVKITSNTQLVPLLQSYWEEEWLGVREQRIEGRMQRKEAIVIEVKATHLMQFTGSLLQSTLHLNRSQFSHPIGGVRPIPLSNPSTVIQVTTLSRTSSNFMLEIYQDALQLGCVIILPLVTPLVGAKNLNLDRGCCPNHFKTPVVSFQFPLSECISNSS